MPLNSAELAKIATLATTAFDKENPTDQVNVARPLLDALLPKAMPLESGLDGFTVNIYKDNNANGQYVSGNGKVNYNVRTPNALAKFDHAFHHDGYLLNEDELFRAGIRVTDDVGKRTSTVSERIKLADMIQSNAKALREGAEDFVHAAMWLDGSQYADAKPGIDAIVSTTPTAGTLGNIASNATNSAGVAYWQNLAYTGLGSTYAALSNALEAAKRQAQMRKGRFTHIFAGGAMIDALRTAAIALNASQIQYAGGSKLKIELGTDKLNFDGIPIVYVPDFDTNFGFSAPSIPWTKRLYALNLEDGIQFRKDTEDFMKLRNAGRPIDQYTYYFGITSKFAMATRKRNTNAVLTLA